MEPKKLSDNFFSSKFHYAPENMTARPMNLIIIKIQKWDFGVEKKKKMVHC